MGRAGHFLYEENIVPITHPEFTARDADIAECFEGVHRTTIPDGRPWPAGFCYQVHAIVRQEGTAGCIVAEDQLIAHSPGEVIQKGLVTARQVPIDKCRQQRQDIVAMMRLKLNKQAAENPKCREFFAWIYPCVLTDFARVNTQQRAKFFDLAANVTHTNRTMV